MLRNSIPSTVCQGSFWRTRISTSTKPALVKALAKACSSKAPLIQPLHNVASSCKCCGTGPLETMSLMTARPPGFSTRKISLNNCMRSSFLTKFRTQFETTTSTPSFAIIGEVCRSVSACCSAATQLLASCAGDVCKYSAN